MTEVFDDDPADDRGFPRVPPPPSVTPGSAPSPPDSVVEDPVETRGCFTIIAIAAVLAVLGLVAAVALVVIGKGLFDGSTDDATKLQEVFIETGIASASTDAEHPPQRDVKLGTCEFDGADGIRAAGTLTNWTSSTADYVIDVSFRRSGTNGSGEEFATDTVLVEAVPEHATTNWAATTSQPPDGAFACRIVAINRWPNGSRPPS